jgi:dipeptidyl aminopeptidase/acylaminoacyl peptidase
VTNDPRPMPTYRDFADVISYQRALAWSPDSTQIAYSCDASGQYNLWIQPVDGGPARQLTDDTEKAVRDIAWSPDGRQILFTADRQGDEFYQLYLIPAEGGEPVALTDRPDVQYFLASTPWSPDGSAIAYAGNDREPTAQDIIVRDIATGDERRVIQDGKIHEAGNWSPDGTYLTTTEFQSNTRSQISVIEIGTGEREVLDLADEPALFNPGPWSADGAGFWVATDVGREFMGIQYYNAQQDSAEWVLEPEWDIEAIDASPDGRYLAWSLNAAGYSQVTVRDLSAGEDVDLPDLPPGILKPWSRGLWFSPDSSKLALFLVGATHAAEIFVIDLAAQTVTRLTDSMRSDLSGVELIEPELIDFPTFDGRQIPGWLFRPHGDGPFPVVLSIHGGPEAQERPQYDDLYQYLLSRGIGILAPNIRGSSGYGKSYQKLIHGDLGGNDLKDFEAAVTYLHSLPWVDRDRIGVFGGSYGGFAVLSCVSRLPDYWAAAVDIVGPSNLVTAIESFPPTWREVGKETFGDPETDREDMLRRSPITYVDQIKTPLFVIQGANDPRVKKAESDQIVEALRERNIPVRYDVYEDEGHGFTKKENELKSIGDTAAFFEEHLLGV